LVILYFDKAAIGTDPELAGRAGEQRIDFLVGQLETDWHGLAVRNLKHARIASAEPHHAITRLRRRRDGAPWQLTRIEEQADRTVLMSHQAVEGGSREDGAVYAASHGRYDRGTEPHRRKALLK